jgi:FeS assembly SUF system regulator
MIRLTKLTDYGIVLMSRLSAEPEEVLNVSTLAAETRIAAPTVAKILKVLSREGLLRSQRGASGGYSLAKEPGEISIADVIAAMEGPIAMTECAEHGPGECVQESVCRVRGNWQVINDAVRGALENISLAEMAQPLGFPPSSTSEGLVHLGSA